MTRLPANSNSSSYLLLRKFSRQNTMLIQQVICPKGTVCFRSPKRILTETQAKEIFQIYLAEFSPTSSTSILIKRKNSTSTRLATMYGVSPKTIRDVWNGRTWTSVTSRIVNKEGISSRLQAAYNLFDQVRESNHPTLVFVCHSDTGHDTAATCQGWPTKRIER